MAEKWESGGGGMVSTAADYARFLQMLLNGGTLDGKRILGPRTVAYMTADHLGSAVPVHRCSGETRGPNRLVIAMTQLLF